MRTSEERVEELHRRMNTVREKELRRRAYTMYTAAGAIGLSVVILLALMVSRLPVAVQTIDPGGTAASIFADNAALGYVVIAIVAFALGIFLTILCFRLKKRMDKEKHDDRKS